ncbi:leucine-rich repeat domain-containing protein [uncultured Draconibacterium sp.]|uniref:leucine-rich repeat domain-containing protein n=1 Tax=uncultured Draconibacterium sp. TaxID=1573823 RepID=UPI002AA73B0E|nr:leucine-rich repeat domain-containing protein [uncultured Draconibacterium sp.]
MNLLFLVFGYSASATHVLTLDDVFFEKHTGTIVGYNGTATDIEIPGSFTILDSVYTVTTIGELAFTNSIITNIKIPNTVTTIKRGAFWDSKLVSVTIPSSVQHIPEWCFYNTQIVNLTIPDGVVSIGEYAFANSEIISVTFGNDLDSIADNAFPNNKIATLLIPDGVEYIGKGAFGGNQIASVKLSSGLSFVSSGAFSKNKLTSITIPEGVKVIGGEAFFENNLSEVSFPNSLETIHLNAFRTNQISEIVLPERLKYIGANAFNGNQIDNVTIPDSVTYIGGGAFYGNNLSSLILPDAKKQGSVFMYWLGGEQNTRYMANTEVNKIGQSYTATFVSARYTLTLDDVDFDELTGEIKSYKTRYEIYIVIPPSFNVNGTDVAVTSIGEFAFSGDRLRSIVIPATVTSIGMGAFNNNSITMVNDQPSNGIIYARNSDGSEDRTTIISYGGTATEMDFIPQGVTTIGEFAFYGCDLTSVSLPTSIYRIHEGAFESNEFRYFALPVAEKEGYNFSHWEDSFGYIVRDLSSVSAYNNYTAQFIDASLYILTLDDVTFDETTGTITSYTNQNEKKIAIPVSFHVDGANIRVKVIGEKAFYDHQLEEVSLTAGTQTISESAFELNSISSLTLPAGITEIERAAFNNNTINQINGQASNGIIYARNEDGSEDLSTIISYGGTADVIDFIPNKVNKIEKYAFVRNQLTSVTIPKSVFFIGAGAFTENILTSFVLPDSQKEDHELNGWMDSNGYLIKANTTVTNLESQYEAMFSSLSYILKYEDVGFDESTGSITSYYNMVEKNITIPATFNVNGKIVAIKSIKKEAFDYKQLTSVNFENGIEEIGIAAFMGNSLTKISIPTSVTKIGGGAFNANQISIVSGQASNGIIYARNEDGSIDNSKIVSYGGSAKHIDFIPNNVTCIGDYAFLRCELTGVTLPKSVTEIGYKAFWYNHIMELEIPNSVTVIGEEAFYGNWLKTITIPESVTSIGVKAFDNTSINSFVLPKAEKIGFFFSHWEDSNGKSFQADATVTNLNLSYTAIFTEVNVYTIKAGDVTFNEQKGIITNFLNSTEKDIFIPASININGQEIEVKGIADSAFYNMQLNSVTIAEGIDSIGDYAFALNNLTNISILKSSQLDLPEIIKQVALNGITIPNSVSYIGAYAFYNNKLTSVTIPTGVTFIGSNAFGENQLSGFILPQVQKDGYDFNYWEDESGNRIQGNTEVNNLESSYTANLVITSVSNMLLSNFKIYPNPTTQGITVATGVDQSVPVMVFDVAGNMLLSIPIEKTGYIDLSPFAEGTYLVKYKQQTKRIIKL